MLATTTDPKPSSTGLDGVVVAETLLSDVNGERGRLVVRGHDIEALAGRATFEDMALLLLDGSLPGEEDRNRFRAALGRARVRAFTLLDRTGDALLAGSSMDAVRTAVAHLPDSAGSATDIAAMIAVFAAAWSRRRAGAAPVPPDPELGQAADYLRAISGAARRPECVAALDRYLVTVAEHGMNASTFTARVVASTGSDTISAVVAALGALKGPLHGGAPGPVLDMLDAIGAPERAESWLEAELASGRRIMGMGHRIYRVRDPRAAVLEKGIEALESTGCATSRLALARAVERAAEGALRARHPGRPLHANVEFYTAVILDAVDIPRELFLPTFALVRCVGWCAHIEEQRACGRLVRPASLYVGPRPS